MVGAFNAEVRAAHLNGLLLALPESGAFTRQTLKYISGAWDLDKDALDAILLALRPEEGGALMGNTLWDIEERAERRAERRAQAKYLAQGKADTLLAQLRLKFNGLSDEAASKVRAAPVEQLDVWLAAILTAADIDEFLAAKP